MEPIGSRLLGHTSFFYVTGIAPNWAGVRKTDNAEDSGVPGAGGLGDVGDRRRPIRDGRRLIKVLNFFLVLVRIAWWLTQW